MSLLMKALEKAAKDRMDARAEPVAAEVAAPVPAAKELALEPLGVEASAAPKAEVTPRPGPAAVPGRDQGQAQASTVLQASAAGRPASRGVGAYVRAHPLPVLGTIAGIFALGFGIYVYLQIAHPGLFIERPPLAAPAKGPVAPIAQAPAPAGLQPAPPLPAAPLLKEAAAESVPAARRQKPQPAVAAAAPEEPASRNTVVVSPGSADSVLNPLLPQAYSALQSGQLEQAQRLYHDVLAAEAKNIDALLGLAAVAVRQGDSDEATRRYLQVLELEPQNALAQSGLIALLGRADPVAAESKLRQLIARQPSAHLYFTLGNLYADQSQWAAAQQSYFQAHYLEPGNPDYAYNLAVGLEHVSQPKLALGFYQRAMQLAAVRGRANFNLAQAQERIGKLTAQGE